MFSCTLEQINRYKKIKQEENCKHIAMYVRPDDVRDLYHDFVF